MQRCLDRLIAKVEKAELARLKALAPPEKEKVPKPPVELFCICRKPYYPQWTMICCDVCEEWYHPKCVGVSNKRVELLDAFVCPKCEQDTGKASTWLAKPKHPPVLWPTGEQGEAAEAGESAAPPKPKRPKLQIVYHTPQPDEEDGPRGAVCQAQAAPPLASRARSLTATGWRAAR